VNFGKAKEKAVEPTASAPKEPWAKAPIQQNHIIVSTGFALVRLPGHRTDGDLIWTYFEAMVPPSMPKSSSLWGLAQSHRIRLFYAPWGADVTVVELMPQVMPVETPKYRPLRESVSKTGDEKILTEAKKSPRCIKGKVRAAR